MATTKNIELPSPSFHQTVSCASQDFLGESTQGLEMRGGGCLFEKIKCTTVQKPDEEQDDGARSVERQENPEEFHACAVKIRVRTLTSTTMTPASTAPEQWCYFEKLTLIEGETILSHDESAKWPERGNVGNWKIVRGCVCELVCVSESQVWVQEHACVWVCMCVRESTIKIEFRNVCVSWCVSVREST